MKRFWEYRRGQEREVYERVEDKRKEGLGKKEEYWKGIGEWEWRVTEEDLLQWLLNMGY